MSRFSAFALFGIIALSVAVMFVPSMWAAAIPETMPCLLAAAWMIRLALGRGRVRYSPVLAAMLGTIAIGLVQVLLGTTVYPWPTWLSVVYWLGSVSVVFVSLQALSDNDNLLIFLRSLVIFAFAVTIEGSLQALSTDAVVYWRFPTEYRGWVVMGPFVYHNQYAAFIELVLPIAIYLAFSDRVWRWLYLVGAAAMFASIFISGSRAGLVLTTTEMLLVPLVLTRSAKRGSGAVFRAAGILVAMVALLAFSAGPEFLLNRFRDKDPYSIRREFLYSSIRMLHDRPLLGFGLGNWPTSYPAYALFDDGLYANQAHNDWIQWGVEGGIPMVVIMLSIAVFIVPKAVRSGWGCGVAVIFVHCLVDYPIQRPAVAVVFFALLGAIASRKFVSAPLL